MLLISAYFRKTLGFVKILLHYEGVENLPFFSQTAGNGFASGGVLSHTQPDAHTPMNGFEKSQKFVNFWIFLHPFVKSKHLELLFVNREIYIF